jgi:hypothetical protein
MKIPTSRRKAPLFLLAGLVVGGAYGWNSSINAAPSNSSAQPKPAKKPSSTKAAPLVWKTATAAQRAEAAKSIRTQLDAFRADNWDKAITYQSSSLKRGFPSTQAFRQMMESSYPQFADYKTVEFGAARAAGPLVEIRVVLTGRDGVAVGAMYRMVKENGIYRVEGVEGGLAPELGAGANV